MKSHPIFKETFDVFTENDGSDIYQISRGDIGRIIAGLPSELPESVEQSVHLKYDPILLRETTLQKGPR